MKKQNIIIIGATSGIGRALFEKYAADGNRIGIDIRYVLFMIDQWGHADRLLREINAQ